MHALAPARRSVPAVLVGALVLAIGVSVASGASGATVLTGQLPSNERFLVDGVSTLFTFTCDEQRVQKPDGSATDIARCRLEPSETPPSHAAHEDPRVGYESDFFIAGVPGFAGNNIASDWHGVVTPSGNVTMVANFASS
jgi:hypothetical protein